MSLVLSPCSAQAPGDGDVRCKDAPTYPDNEKTMMDSYHYLQLLPGNGSGNIIPGAVWNDRSLDGNDDEMNTINPTYVRYWMIKCESCFHHYFLIPVAARCWRSM